MNQEAVTNAVNSSHKCKSRVCWRILIRGGRRVAVPNDPSDSYLLGSLKINLRGFLFKDYSNNLSVELEKEEFFQNDFDVWLVETQMCTN